MMINCADMLRRMCDRVETSHSCCSLEKEKNFPSSKSQREKKMANNIRFNRLKLQRLTNYFVFVFLFPFCATRFPLEFWFNFNPSRMAAHSLFLSRLLWTKFQMFEWVELLWWGRILWFPNHSNWILMMRWQKDRSVRMPALSRSTKLHSQPIYHFETFPMTLTIADGVAYQRRSASNQRSSQLLMPSDASAADETINLVYQLFIKYDLSKISPLIKITRNESSFLHSSH